MKDQFTHLAEGVVARCRALASFSEDVGKTRRTFLSPPMKAVHRAFAEWLDPLGATVKIDAAGNLRALYPANDSPSPRLLIGSHLDTVPDAGAFDGILGVVLAVALLEALDKRSCRTPLRWLDFPKKKEFASESPSSAAVPWLADSTTAYWPRAMPMEPPCGLRLNSSA